MLHILYKKLIKFYPQKFREQLAESMEQTFNDRYIEVRNTKQGLFGFTIWTFADTTIGIFREHLLLVYSGVAMQNILKTIGSPALISLLLISPFIIMEIVNRRQFNEEFPFVLFIGLWTNLFAATLILLPILLAKRAKNNEMEISQRNALLTNPKWAAVISIALILSPGIFPLMESIGWLSLDRLFNGTNPEVEYLPGMFLSFSLILLPIGGGIIAGRPIVNTLRSGGSLFAHPFHLIIVAVLSFLFISGVTSLIIDQWPCFIGVPVCD
jgi:hypothetical protein